MSRKQTDLVLLDLGLPDGDGTEVCASSSATIPTVPVVVLTARREEIDVVLGLEAGAVDYVVKPFRLAELLARDRDPPALRGTRRHTGVRMRRHGAWSAISSSTGDRGG